MSIGMETQVADVATRHPATIRVFQRYGVDFCCGGKRSLADVCAERNLSFAELRSDLEAAVAAPSREDRDWGEASLDELISHILTRYHRPLDEELPRLGHMMDKVLAVHVERHSELRGVARTFGALVDDLQPHMMKEEQVLFPYVLRMEALRRSGGILAGSPFGSVESPIRVMELEHEAVGELLALLREMTAGYTAPDDACNTFRGLYHGLVELERDLHEHIHLENNVLFPRAAQRERELLAAAAPAR